MKRSAVVLLRDPEMRNQIAGALRHDEREVISRHISEGCSVLIESRDVGAFVVGDDLIDGAGGMILRKAQAARPDLFLALVHKRAENEYVATVNGEERVEESPTALGEWLALALREVEQRQSLQPAAAAERGDAAAGVAIDTESEEMRRILQIIAVVAPTEATVLLQGESGTGKDLLANLIHSRSRRSKEPLVEVHCGAIPPSLMESELFGHEKGSFTGASSRKVGLFMSAECGTLFLDEIGELPLDMQVKLLRVLQSGWLRPIGSNHSIKVDVRVIAATNRDLKKEVLAGHFRLDLYYRLNVIGIHVPPLRERSADIPLLVRATMARLGRGAGADAPLPAEVMAALLAYGWPGNVRELENVVERILLLHPDGRIPLPELHAMLMDVRIGEPVEMRRSQPESAARFAESAAPSAPSEPSGYSDRMTLKELEDLHVRRVLKRCGGNMTQAARELGINVKTLYNKMKASGLKRQEFLDYA